MVDVQVRYEPEHLPETAVLTWIRVLVQVPDRVAEHAVTVLVKISVVDVHGVDPGCYPIAFIISPAQETGTDQVIKELVCGAGTCSPDFREVNRFRAEAVVRAYVPVIVCKGADVQEPKSGSRIPLEHFGYRIVLTEEESPVFLFDHVVHLKLFFL